VLAREFGIGRAEQDQFALTSHQRTVAAWKRGYFAEEVVPIPADVTRAKELKYRYGPARKPDARSTGQAKTHFRSREWYRHAGE
jgi:acetyl-CoA acetyltransferase